MAGQDKPESQWHFSKTINIGHILTTLVIAAGILTWSNAIDKRVSSNSLSIQYLTEEQSRASERIETLRTEQRQDFKSINDKLDQLIRDLSNE